MIATDPEFSTALIAKRVPRVLFVDDEPVLANLGQRFLEHLGCDPVVTTDAVAALEFFRSGDFDLVITDLAMPELTGIDLSQQIRDICPVVPIILTTAYHTMLEGRTAKDLGFAELVFKPYTLASLGEVVRRALAGAG